MLRHCYLTLGFAWLTLAAPAFSQNQVRSLNKVPGSVESTAQRLANGLKKQGFEVSRGYFKLYTKDDCQYSYAVMQTCYGNNPAAPYVMSVVPAWPDEFVDPATQGAFGPTVEGYSGSYRLDPREAIVILGLLPPPAAYFGLQTYEFTRKGAYDTSSPQYVFFSTYAPAMLNTFFGTVPKNSSRVRATASLSDSNNNVVIERQSGAAFDQVRFFIITPDKFMDNAVRLAFRETSIEERNIFTEPIPPTMRTGLGEEADDFVSFIRYARPVDAARADAWRKDLPLVVLRVREAQSSGRSPEPYPIFTPEPRTAWDEVKYLSTDQANLASAIAAKWEQACNSPGCPSRLLNLQVPPPNLVGPLCTPIGMDCLGDTQDTVYHMSPALSLDNGEVYALAGPLGTKDGNATYVSVGINSKLYKKGLAEVPDSELSGTAAGYSALSYPEKFFVYYFTRDCSGLDTLTDGNCFSIPESMIPACTGDPAKCDRLSLSLRDYIRPGTARGPDAGLTLPPVIVKLKR